MKVSRVHDLTVDSPHVLMTSRSTTLPTFSLANLKGGAAKTVSSVVLAEIMARSGANVLLVDLDPQGTASAWLSERSDAATRLLTSDFDPSEGIIPVFEPEEGGRLDIVTANRSLEDAAERRASDLSRRLEKLWRGAAEGYDVGMVDTPPQAGRIVTAALLSTSGAIVPVAAGRGAVDGLQHVLQYTRRIGGAGVEAAFACNVDARTYLDRRVAEKLIDQLGPLSDDGRACRHYVRSTVSVREAEADGSPLGAYAPRSTAWTDYNALAEELSEAEVIPSGSCLEEMEDAASVDHEATT